MVIIDTTALKAELTNHKEKPSRLSVLAGSSPATLQKLLGGDGKLRLRSIAQIADYLGLDVTIGFVKKNGGNPNEQEPSHIIE